MKKHNKGKKVKLSNQKILKWYNLIKQNIIAYVEWEKGKNFMLQNHIVIRKMINEKICKILI